jgi:predicted permease
MLDTLRQDLRYAIRVLAGSPGFSAIAILTLALGMGATTAFFSQVNAVFWRQLPVERPSELRTLVWSSAERGFVNRAQVAPGPTVGDTETFTSFSYPAYAAMRDEASDAFTDLACWIDPSINRPIVMGERGLATVHFVSGNFFRTLGVTALLGRTLEPDDDQEGATSSVAVLSHSFWLRAFGGRRDVLGESFTLNSFSFTVVGVLPEGFFGIDPSVTPDLMLPIPTVQLAVNTPNILQNNGRLRAGVSESEARARAESGVGRAILDNPPGPNRPYELPTVWMLDASQGLGSLRTSTSLSVLTLMGAASVVLLIACANIAGLLGARGHAREREIATRLAVGAPRSRLMRQLVTESLVLAAAGGLAGAVVAYLLSGVVPSLLVQLLPSVYGLARDVGVAVTPDLRVFGFAAVLVVATGLLFGLLPARRATRVDLVTLMKPWTRKRVRGLGLGGGKAAVAIQVALCMLLLVGAGLFVRTVTNLRSTDLGYDPTGLMYVRIEPRSGGVPSAPRDRVDFLEQAVLRLESAPGVTVASAVAFAVCTTFFNPEDEEERTVGVNEIMPDFFRAMRLPLVAGREFEWADRQRPGASVPARAVVNEAFVRQYFAPGTDPIGQGFGRNCANNPAVFTVIGVVADSKAMPRSEIRPTVYRFLGEGQSAYNPFTIVLRTAGDPDSLMPALQRSIRQLNPGVPLFGAASPIGLRDEQIRQERLLRSLLILFGSTALLLCCVGLYGLLAYAVAMRRSEIGLRMALGAARGQVVRLVLAESIGAVAVGLLAGVAAAFVLARYVGSFLYGVGGPDPLTIAAVAVIFVSIAGVAAALPARRASRLDPLKALRQE